MSWAEIKKAINSTLGTNNFKPLNEIFQDSMVLYASDNSIVVNSVKAKVNYSGTCRIKAVIQNTLSSPHSAQGTFYIYINNANNYTSYSIANSVPGKNLTETHSFDINVSKGDIIWVSFNNNFESGGALQSWSLCGMIGLGGVIAETTS